MLGGGRSWPPLADAAGADEDDAAAAGREDAERQVDGQLAGVMRVGQAGREGDRAAGGRGDD